MSQVETIDPFIISKLVEENARILFEKISLSVNDNNNSVVCNGEEKLNQNQSAEKMTNLLKEKENKKKEMLRMRQMRREQSTLRKQSHDELVNFLLLEQEDVKPEQQFTISSLAQIVEESKNNNESTSSMTTRSETTRSETTRSETTRSETARTFSALLEEKKTRRREAAKTRQMRREQSTLRKESLQEIFSQLEVGTWPTTQEEELQYRFTDNSCSSSTDQSATTTPTMTDHFVLSKSENNHKLENNNDFQMTTTSNSNSNSNNSSPTKEENSIIATLKRVSFKLSHSSSNEGQSQPQSRINTPSHSPISSPRKSYSSSQVSNSPRASISSLIHSRVSSSSLAPISQRKNSVVSLSPSSSPRVSTQLTPKRKGSQSLSPSSSPRTSFSRTSSFNQSNPERKLSLHEYYRARISRQVSTEENEKEQEQRQEQGQGQGQEHEQEQGQEQEQDIETGILKRTSRLSVTDEKGHILEFLDFNNLDQKQKKQDDDEDDEEEDEDDDEEEYDEENNNKRKKIDYRENSVPVLDMRVFQQNDNDNIDNIDMRRRASVNLQEPFSFKSELNYFLIALKLEKNGKELSTLNETAFNMDWIEIFHSSSNRVFKNWTQFLLFRITMLLFSGILLFFSLTDFISRGNFGYWFIYFVNWTLIINCLYFSFAVFTTIKSRNWGSELLANYSESFTSKIPRYVHFTWILQSISLPGAFIALVLFWTEFWGPKPETYISSFIQSNLIIIPPIADFLISSQPFLLVHSLYYMLYSVSYLVFTIIYACFDMTNENGQSFIYQNGNYQSPDISARLSPAIILFLFPFIMIFVWWTFFLRNEVKEFVQVNSLLPFINPLEMDSRTGICCFSFTSSSSQRTRQRTFMTHEAD